MFIFNWLADLLTSICSEINSVVDVMEHFANSIIEATDTMVASTSARTMEMGTILDCCYSLKYVIGDYLYYCLVTFIIFGCAYATFRFVKQLAHILYGDNGIINKSGITNIISKLFKK